ncbi:MAG: phosphate/phosphite/phosphonate ABC transporter substrate-binding protein [Deltaproteobacteria bacterium]|nr:phosphate/phosphite/phosphonate ABC transporter substrate-binding protein [Deltaproteobacteria bacterium]
MQKLLGILMLLSIGFVGCSKPEADPLASGTSAGSRRISIGLIPEQNIFRQLDRYDPIARYLSRKTGTNIELKVLRRYGNIFENFKTGNMDGAFFGSFTYVLGHSKLGVEAIATPVWLNGESRYHGCFVIRKDSAIRGPGDMRGKVLALVDKVTMAGYLYPMVYLQSNGITDPKKYFKETYFAGTHRDVVYDVLAGRADIGAVKNTIFARLASQDARVAAELTLFGRSAEVPENSLAVRADLEPSLKVALKEALLAMDRDPEGAAALATFGARRFVATSDADFEPVVKYARQIGTDLATFEPGHE